MTDWWQPPVDRAGLVRARRLVEAAGLVKVYDGQRFIDLRDVLLAVLDTVLAAPNVDADSLVLLDSSNDPDLSDVPPTDAK
jgi:hypothetical protein